MGPASQVITTIIVRRARGPRAMPRPRTSPARTSRLRTCRQRRSRTRRPRRHGRCPRPISTAQPRHQAIPQRGNARLELRRALRIPLRAALPGHRLRARERNIEHVRRIVPAIPVHAVAVTQRARRQTRLADNSRTVISIRVAPYTVKHIPPAHDCHHAKGLDAVVLRGECRVTGLGPFVAEDDVRVDVGVEVGDAVGGNGVFEGGFVLRIRGGGAAAVAAGLRAVAVDVHVGEGVGAFDEDGLSGDGLLAVGPIWDCQLAFWEHVADRWAIEIRRRETLLFSSLYRGRV